MKPTVMRRRSMVALPAVAVLALGACSATDPIEETESATSVTLENCGTKVTYDLPIEKVVATSNGANIGTILRVGGLDKLAAVTLNANNDAVMESMFGPGIAGVPHLDGTITMETVLGKQADLVVGSYSGLFKGASGVTPESLGQNGIGAYVISDSCRQGTAQDAPMGTMGPWDALRADVANYGSLFGTQDEATEAATELDTRLDRLEQAPQPDTAPKVLIYDSGEEDLYTSGGNGAPNGIIDAAGGTNVFADVDNTWFRASWETVAGAEPDVIVIMDYKKSSDEVQGKIDAIKAREGLRDLDAVKQNRFVVLPLAMFTSGFPNIYGAEQLRGKLEEFALVPESGADWSAAPNQ